MNDTDLWNEAEDCVDNKDKKLQKIGEQLFELYDIAYNWDNSNPTLNSQKQKIKCWLKNKKEFPYSTIEKWLFQISTCSNITKHIAQ